MSKKILLAVLILFITIINIGIIYADNFDVEYKIINNEIEIDEKAEFEIVIHNYKAYEDRFRFEFILDNQWRYDTQPNYLGGIEVPAKDDAKVNLIIYPYIVAAGQHSIKIVIKSEKTNALRTIWPIVNVKSTGEYVPPTEANIAGDLEIKDNVIDPRKENVLTVKLKNNNLLFIKDLNLSVESDLINLKKYGVQLGPLEERKIEFKFSIDAKTPPKKEILTLKWTAKEKEFVYEKSFDIIGYTIPFSTVPKTEKSFLKTKESIEVLNIGTIEDEQEIRIESNPFKRLFTYTSPSTSLKSEDGKYYLVYKIKLKPGIKKEIRATTNYRIPIYLIIIIGIVLYLYYKYRSPVTIKKKATIAKILEGGISEIKILLHVKNRSGRTIDEVNITDSIPHIGEIDKEIQIGTIKPVSIAKHKKAGTIVKWSIPSLEQYEERIITYRIKSRLSILGGLVLPSSKVRFKDQGKERVYRSDNLKLKI